MSNQFEINAATKIHLEVLENSDSSMRLANGSWIRIPPPEIVVGGVEYVFSRRILVLGIPHELVYTRKDKS
jgi:Txe/YoeB family toxin of Txe-Axe toxin-antitoxin module